MRAGLAAWVGRHPLFCTAVAMAACVAVADRSLVPAGLLALALGGLGWWVGSWRRGLAWVVCSGLALGVFTWRNHRRDQTAASLLTLGSATVTGRVADDAEGQQVTWVAPVKLQTGPHAGAVVWWQGDGPPPVAGSMVTAEGNFLPLPVRRNPGEFDHGAWLRRQGVAAMFQASDGRGSVTTPPLAARGARVRQAFRSAVTAGLPDDSPAAMTIRAVVIGEHPPDADELVAAFRQSGTLHIFSVSGMHVAMVASIGWLLLRGLRVPRRGAIVALLVLVFGYTWLAGNSAPAVRSAWMAAVFLGAFVFRRRPDLLNSLGLVLFAALLWDGNLLFQPGVQLSYGVVAAIAIGTSWASRYVNWLARAELYLPPELMNPWQRRWLEFRQRCAQSLAVSLAAFVGSTPLTAFHFGLITPISVLATLALIPLVFTLLAAALLAAAVWPLAPRATSLLNQANGRVAEACIATAATLAAVPGGNLNLRQHRDPLLLVYDLDYGAGAAVLSEGTAGAVLFDCGDRYAFKRRIAPSLRTLGITPDAVVLSHPDGHHLGGGAQVWSALPIRQALLPVARSRSRTYQAWLLEAPAAGIRTLAANPAAAVPLPAGASLECLFAPDPQNPSKLADDRVAIFRLHWRGWKILFTSDAGVGTELKLLETGRDLRADVIIAGRHSRDLSLCDAFLDRVRPLAIIASNEAFPGTERLDPRQVHYWRQLGIQVFDQAQAGGVTLEPAATGELVLTGFVDHSSARLTRR
jgi:ComEC/Rec2-related protein